LRKSVKKVGMPSCMRDEEDGQDAEPSADGDVIAKSSSSSAQTALQSQHNQQHHGEQHKKCHNCLELVRLPPLELLGWRHDDVFDAVQHSTKHGPRTSRDDVARIHTTSSCTLEQTEDWSGSEDRLPKSSKGTLCKSQ
jgi:hypothetical protein